MPSIVDLKGGSALNHCLGNLSKSEKLNASAQKSLSSGVWSEEFLDPYDIAQGNIAKSKIAEHKVVSLQCLDASHVCQSMNTAIGEGLRILTEQMSNITSANADINGQTTKIILDQSFQTALLTFESTMNSIRWNTNTILTGTPGTISSVPIQGIYNTLNAASSLSSGLSFGVGYTNVESFFECMGNVSGAVGTITSFGNFVQVQIGTQTFEADISALTLNNGSILKLTDSANANNTISFQISGTNPSAGQISTGISSILSGMTFSPVISGLTPVANYFTGGVNYNYSKGNYTGIAQSVNVQQNGGQFDITIGIAQSSTETQFFKATINGQPTANSPLVFNSISNSQNSIAFNFASSLSTPVTEASLQNALTSLLGVGSAPASFQSQCVSPYQGLTLTAGSGTSIGTYGLTYTVLSSNDAEFTLNTGDQVLRLRVQRPLQNNMILCFDNGFSIKINNVSTFDETTSKAQSLLKITASNSQNILYFQMGTRSSDQMTIPCPALSLNALNLQGQTLQTTQSAKTAAVAVEQAIKILSSELNRIGNIAKRVEQRITEEDNLMVDFENLKQDHLGTDVAEALVIATTSDGQIDISRTSLVQEVQRMQKELEFLEKVSSVG